MILWTNHLPHDITLHQSLQAQFTKVSSSPQSPQGSLPPLANHPHTSHPRASPFTLQLTKKRLGRVPRQQQQRGTSIQNVILQATHVTQRATYVILLLAVEAADTLGTTTRRPRYLLSLPPCPMNHAFISDTPCQLLAATRLEELENAQ